MSRRDDPVRRLWEGVCEPSRDDLRAAARTAAAGEQLVDAPAARRHALTLRWAVAFAVVALLIGSGLGFGLSGSLTPESTAGRNVVGFGLLPEAGWKVVQTVGVEPGRTTATATRPGIVLVVTSTPRGDPAKDVGYVSRELPLRVADARPASGSRERLVLRAGVGGYNVDARIDFAVVPTTRTLRLAQRQLNRLVIAADRVTIAVRPAISSPLTGQVTVFGTIDSGKAGESVTVQAKDCGTTFFRVFAGASTEEGGTWSTFIFPYVTTRLRAVWNGETSAEVVFRQRVFIGLQQSGASRFRVNVGARSARFDGRPVTIQQFNQRIGRWESARRVVLTDEVFTHFTLRVPKGTRLRAVFPNAQAKPCYLGATSSVIRT